MLAWRNAIITFFTRFDPAPFDKHMKQNTRLPRTRTPALRSGFCLAALDRFFSKACDSLACQPYLSLFPVGGARGREKYVWTLWPASHVASFPGLPRSSVFVQYNTRKRIILNENRRTKNGGGLGTRLLPMAMDIRINLN